LPPHPTSEEEGSTSAYLADMHALCEEFRRATNALASNDVLALEAGIRAQEELVDRLHRGPGCQKDRQAKISTRQLHELTEVFRVYSSLLQRSLRSVKLRLALCRTYQQVVPNTSADFTTATTLSCEV
jgi:hypothetical protein